MSERVELICPRCQHEWWQSLDELEKMPETIYRSISYDVGKSIQKYRARCPNDGTYVIVEIGEEENDG